MARDKKRRVQTVQIVEDVHVPDGDEFTSYLGVSEVNVRAGRGVVPPPDPPSAGVPEANLKVVGEAGAMATALLYHSQASSTGLAYENAVHFQQQLTLLAQNTTVVGSSLLLSLPGGESAEAVAQLDRSDVADFLTALRSLRDASDDSNPQ